MRHSLTSRLAAKSRAEAEVSRRKKAEHQAKQITAAMEEAKKAAAKRREEALEQLAKEEAEELRRYEADLAKATQTPGAGQPLLSGSRTSAPRAPLTKQAIRTSRYPGATIFANCEVHLRPLRGALPEGGVQPSSASFCRGTRYTVEFFGRTRPPQAAGQGPVHSLDLTWTAVDRDLWPLGSWNKSLGEQGPKPRCELPKGKGKGPLSERAIWHSGNSPEVLELTEADRQLVCRHPPAPFGRSTSLRSSCPEAATLTR
eukprot:s9671_g1.t1